MIFARISRISLALCATTTSIVACGSSNATTPAPEAGTDSAGSAAMGDPQTPPIGGAAVEAWLSGGAYKTWHSEVAIHASRTPSPHGFDRIYSNGIINANMAQMGEWPVGAAAVKELYASATDTVPVGYAVYRKTQAASAGGANWYWYERVPTTSSVPHDANGVVADGLGTSGPALTICVGCHGAAGSDAAHTPSVGGHDQVYTPIP